jgi:formylglycine-generating enzyme required for sulfatase activity
MRLSHDDTNLYVTDIGFSDCGSTGPVGEPGRVFSVYVGPPTLVRTPNGGESWVAGTKQNIQWRADPCITNVTIEYSTNNGTDWNNVVTIANTGSHDWLVPQINSNQCLARISDAADANIFDTSDKVFTIFLCQLSSKADLNNDCKVDFTDLALFANDWLRNGNPFDPSFTEPAEGMVVVPGGTFQMGDNIGDGPQDNLPVHTVTLDSFYMGKFEVTNQQYCDYLNSALLQGLITVASDVVYQAGSGTTYPYCDTSTSSSDSQIAHSGGVFTVRTKSGRDMANDPMVMVTWYGAAAYCNWRSQQEGKEQCYNLSTWNCDFSKKGYRLATEAEWEYAARGGLAGRRFPWGDTISHSQANFRSYWSGGHPYYPYDVSPTEGCHPLWNDGIYPYTSPVGFFDGSLREKDDFNWPGSQTSYQTSSGANSYGLYDMSGNVWEWCYDRYGASYYEYCKTLYGELPFPNPTGPPSGSYRVHRGGGWDYPYDALNCRVANRDDGVPYLRHYHVGFRVVLDF